MFGLHHLHGRWGLWLYPRLYSFWSDNASLYLEFEALPYHFALESSMNMCLNSPQTRPKYVVRIEANGTTKKVVYEDPQMSRTNIERRVKATLCTDKAAQRNFGFSTTHLPFYLWHSSCVSFEVA
jgi:hypothetical protein